MGEMDRKPDRREKRQPEEEDREKDKDGSNEVETDGRFLLHAQKSRKKKSFY